MIDIFAVKSSAQTFSYNAIMFILLTPPKMLDIIKQFFSLIGTLYLSIIDSNGLILHGCLKPCLHCGGSGNGKYQKIQLFQWLWPPPVGTQPSVAIIPILSIAITVIIGYRNHFMTTSK